MKQEQLKWSDAQWANYLSCTIEEYKQARDFINNIYVINIGRDRYTGKYCVELAKREDTPSGNIRYIKKLSAFSSFHNVDKVISFANEQFIPSLELNDLVAKNYNVPSKILQTLHVKTR